MWQDLLFVIVQFEFWIGLFLGLLGAIIIIGTILLYIIGAKLEYDDLKEKNARSTIS